MADAISTTTVTVASTAATGSGPVAVTVASEAETALQLVDGLTIEGTAAARPVKGMVEITTADGQTLQIKAQPGTTLPGFAAGTRLTLQMVGGGAGGGGQLFLVAINGRGLAGPIPPGQGVLGATPPMMPLPPGPTNAAAGTAPQRTPMAGQDGTAFRPGGPLGAIPPTGPAATGPLGLSATLIRPARVPGEPPPAPPFAGTAGLPPDLPAGTRLTVRIAGVALPDGGGDTLDALPPLPPGSLSSAMPAGAPAARPGGGAMPSPPSGVPAATATGGAVPLLPATVVAHPPGGHAVVQTAIGTLAVPTHADLPAGTQLTLEVVGQPLPPLPGGGDGPPATPTGLTAQGWPTLSQALDVLAAADQPQALQQLLRIIPQPDARLAASMVAFSGALRTGELKSLLPESTVRGLEKAGKKELAGRLRAELESLSEESGRPVGNGDWRVYPMPMLGGGVVEPVRLYVRKAGDDGGGGKAGGGKGNDHRFVVDLNLTRLGRLQLDGLVRREDKLFDLIIRTDAALDADVRRDILGIFSNASELVGTKGSVSFQAGGRWMEFPPAPPAPTRIEV